MAGMGGKQTLIKVFDWDGVRVVIAGLPNSPDVVRFEAFELSKSVTSGALGRRPTCFPNRRLLLAVSQRAAAISHQPLR